MKKNIYIHLLVFAFATQVFQAAACPERLALEALYSSAPTPKVFSGEEALIAGKFKQHAYLGKEDRKWFEQRRDLKKEYGSYSAFLRSILSDVSDEAVRIEFGEDVVVKVSMDRKLIVALRGKHVVSTGMLDSEDRMQKLYGAVFSDHVDMVAKMRILPQDASFVVAGDIYFANRGSLGRHFKKHKEGLGVYSDREYLKSARENLAKKGPNTLRLLTYRKPGNQPVLFVLDLESRQATSASFIEELGKTAILTHFQSSRFNSFLNLVFAASGSKRISR